MKKSTLALAFLACFIVPSSFSGELNIEWVSPEKYRDVKPSDNMGRKKFREQTLKRLQTHLSEWAAKLPNGSKLNMKVTNVDLAGDVQPWHNGNWIRVIKSPYAPMMKFSYSYTDANGKTELEGEELLRDMAFDMRMSRTSISEVLVYEKHMIDEWFGNTFDQYLAK